tara:strand:- start:469 stop:681 length:213 start_codon:yes stop_codon:yes gene_type:complete
LLGFFFGVKMDWTKILWALVLVGFLAFLIPQWLRWRKDAPEAEPGAWSSAMLPIGGVVLFVLILIISVQN